MNTKIAILVGTSGVGKSTFLNKLSCEIGFQHFSAGELIQRENQRSAHAGHYDLLRFRDLSDNQSSLIKGFNREKDPTASLIFLDGHSVIDTGTGFKPIPARVFQSLGIGLFVFLWAEPSQISSQRARDLSRERPALSAAKIKQHQITSLSITKEISKELSVPLKVITAGQFKETVSFLRYWLT